MTLQEIIDQVSANIAEPVASSGWFTPTNITRWANDGVLALWRRIHAVRPDFFGQRTVTISTVADTQEYSLPDLIEIRTVERLHPTDRATLLEEVDADQRFVNPGARGTPTRWYWRVSDSGVTKTKLLGLIPTPDQTAVDAIRVRYTALPNPMVNPATDSPDLPTEFHPLVVLWATSAALASDKQPSQYWDYQFNAALQDLLLFVARGRGGGPNYIKYINAY